MLADKSQVTDYIPQKSPMVMVDGLLDHTSVSCTSCFSIETKNIFCKNGLFHEPGLIENIAQTAALHSGYMAKKQNTEIKKGFIGAVKRLKIYELAKVNDTLTTTISILNQVMNAAIVKGEVHVDNKLIAVCEMSIFTQE